MIDFNGVLIFLKGAVLGFSIAAPVGPIGLLCINRTLSHGMRNGLVSGLGAATADGFYGMVAAGGLTSLSSMLIRSQVLFRLFGGAFLLYLGAKTFLSRSTPARNGENRPQPGDFFRAYSSTFALTITNPVTIISFTAIFAGLGIGSSGGSMIGAMMMVAGVFCGSSAWWTILSGVFGLLRSRVNHGFLLWINRVAGTVLFAFGIIALVSLMNN